MSTGPLSAKIPRPADDWGLRRSGGKFFLSSQLWPGELELTASDLFSTKRIRVAAADQKGCFIPAAFDAEWSAERLAIETTSGKPRFVRAPSLLEKLMGGAA